MAGDKGVLCVIYYGMPVQNAKEIAASEGAHPRYLAKQDEWITPRYFKVRETLAIPPERASKRTSTTQTMPSPTRAAPRYNEKPPQGEPSGLAFLKERL